MPQLTTSQGIPPNATGAGTGLSGQFQLYFNKKLLDHAVQLTVYDQAADKVDFPKNTGSKTMRFVRRATVSDPNAAITRTAAGTAADPNVTNGGAQRVFAVGSEGTSFINDANARLTDVSLTFIDAPLVQYYQLTQMSDILNYTQLFDTLKQSVEQMGEDCALHLDSIIRNAFIGGNITGAAGLAAIAAAAGGNAAAQAAAAYTVKRYAQGVSTGTPSGANTFAALVAARGSSSLPPSNVVFGPNDALDAMTQLKTNRCPKLKDRYVGFIPPALSRDLMNDDKFVKAAQYSNVQALYRGEVGEFYGIKLIETTNPFIENPATRVVYNGTVAATANTVSAAEGVFDSSGVAGTAASGTVPPAGQIFSAIFTGAHTVGVPNLASQSPFGPKMIISDKPDKSDPLNQRIYAGWKSYFTAVALNLNWIVTCRAYSSFGGVFTNVNPNAGNNGVVVAPYAPNQPAGFIST